MIITLSLLLYFFNLGSLSAFHPLRKPKKGEIKIACVGDSITYGYGGAKLGKGDYPSALAKRLGKGYAVNNYGYNSRTLSPSGDFPYVKTKLFRKSLSFKPDCLLVMLGTNDSKKQNWIDEDHFRRSYEELLDSFSLPNASIYLLTPIKALNDSFGINEDILGAKICPVIRSLAKEKGYKCIDLHEKMPDLQGLSYDGIHLNKKGYRVMADIIYREIKDEDNEGKE